MPEHQHVSTQFDTDLDALVSHVLRMGGLVEQQIIAALAGFANGDVPALDRVIAADHEINAMEVSVDRECSRIIAKRQPTARDLRLMMAIIKTITDLERSGDEAAKIARMAKQIFERERMKMPRISDIRTAADIALGMLRLSRGSARSALEHFSRYIAHNPKTELLPEALWGQGQALSSLGRQSEARRSYRSLLERYPDSTYASAARAKLEATKSGP